MRKTVLTLTVGLVVFLMISTATAVNATNSIVVEEDMKIRAKKLEGKSDLFEFWLAWIANYGILYVNYMENSIFFKILHPIGNYLVNIQQSDSGFGLVFLYPESLLFFIVAFFVTLNNYSSK